MRKITLLLLFLVFGSQLSAQSVKTPDEIYGQLFRDVQMQKVFSDGKTFVDCVPRRDPALIVSDYQKLKSASGDVKALKAFVDSNFILPQSAADSYRSDNSRSVRLHIEQLWNLLQRQPDKPVDGSSLLPLPHPYIVPGGRFREIYYWDSYFTMLGLQASKKTEIMENMIQNFAYLIDHYGHIPNGNRSYYLSRSQPPFFAQMVGLLAQEKGDQVYSKYLPSLKKEYEYWMKADKSKLPPGSAYRYVVNVNGSFVNRYWDERGTPRQESYREDVETVRKSGREAEKMYRDLRSAATSGWDFSSRWFADGRSLSTIETTDIVAVDLNALLYGLEQTLARASILTGNKKAAAMYKLKAAGRLKFLNQYCWNATDGMYYDYNFKTRKQMKVPSLATVYPLFFKMSSADQAAKVAGNIRQKFLKPGGLPTTLTDTGEQWDAPNGWAPLQWMAIQGLENYRHSELARDIATRWVKLNIRVFHQTGKLMEKYNVMDLHLIAGGGEYPSQDGFGWTNGVLLKLMDEYQLDDSSR